MSSQSISSKNTSLNQVSAVFKKCEFNSGSVILDYGGGKYDKNTEYMRDKGSTVRVYDPYNRSSLHNKQVLQGVYNMGGADYIVCANVLNVIKEDTVIDSILFDLRYYLAGEGCIYIQIYEGNKSGVGAETIKGYQRNCKTEMYMEKLSLVFNNMYWTMVRHGNIIKIKRILNEEGS